MTCCTWRDHQPGPCFCAHHERSDLHPFGEPPLCGMGGVERGSGNPVWPEPPPGIREAVCAGPDGTGCGQTVPVEGEPPRYMAHRLFADVIADGRYDADLLAALRDAVKCSDPWLEAS